MAYYLQSQMGVGLNGLVMVSPYLDPAAIGNETSLSPLPWMINLPSMTAGNYQRQGKPFNDATMAEVGDLRAHRLRHRFPQGHVTAGRDRPTVGARRRLYRPRSSAGPPPRRAGRISPRICARIRRNTGQISSVYEPQCHRLRSLPASAEADYNDPLLDGIIAPTTSAEVDFITNQVGWKSDAHYETLSYAVNKARDRQSTTTPFTDLRKAIANDPKMAVMIAHGWDDLSCPYYGSKLIIDQMPGFGQAERIKLHIYPVATCF